MSENKKEAETIHVAPRNVPAIRFKQWLDEWNNYDVINDGKWRKPEPYMYMFSMNAGDLRNLSDVYRRKYDGDYSEGVQRAQDRSRTAKIQRYVQFGYPFGDLPAPVRDKPENKPLRKPGWLPTAIVINILRQDDDRRGRTVKPEHLVQIGDENGAFSIKIPRIDANVDDYLAPLEVIDGQHRLWAFDGDASVIPDDFELPVVAFHNLDIPWQAYLFWSINVSPKRINRSHAFDLYPLLRTQDWLEQVGELTVYREARAQELTELMYNHGESVWHHRINMLGEKGGPEVSQNAWVKALTSSFLATGRGASSKGLFQSNIGENDLPLSWTRGQQGAFLLKFWQQLRKQVVAGRPHLWIREYRESHLAFDGNTSLLNQDMGLRAVLSVANDVFVLRCDNWYLDYWRIPNIEDGIINDEANAALQTIDTTLFREKIDQLAEGLSFFDWRSLDAPNVRGSEEEILKRSFRGSGGYTALKLEVLKTLAAQEDDVADAARELLESFV